MWTNIEEKKQKKRKVKRDAFKEEVSCRAGMHTLNKKGSIHTLGIARSKQKKDGRERG